METLLLVGTVETLLPVGTVETPKLAGTISGTIIFHIVQTYDLDEGFKVRHCDLDSVNFSLCALVSTF